MAEAIRKPRLLTWAVFLGCMGHLLYLYQTRDRSSGGVAVTASFCVLTLKLIGLAMDISDGMEANVKKRSTLPSTTERRLAHPPSLPALLGYSFFPPAAFVGPQLPYSEYERYVHQGASTHTNREEKPTDPKEESTQAKRHFTSITSDSSLLSFRELCLPVASRAAVGVFFGGLNAAGAVYYPLDAMKDEAFLQSHSFLGLCWYMLVSVRLGFLKYVGVWLLADAACLLSGISARKTLPGAPVSTDPALQNVRVSRFFTATTLPELLDGWNVTTNVWIRRHIHKRIMARTGARGLSVCLTMLFVSLWHGVCFGYIHTFLMEASAAATHSMFYRAWERRVVYPVGKRRPDLVALPRRVCNFLGWFAWNIVLFQYGGSAFLLLHWQPVTQLYTSLYWCGHLGIAVTAAIAYAAR